MNSIRASTTPRHTFTRWFSVMIGLLLCPCLFWCSHPAYDNSVAAIGDTYSYQTMAVNLAEKNVFPVTGMLLSDTAYHFKLVDYPGAYTAEHLRSDTSHLTFYRNPLYPLFCGLIYKVAGVRTSVLFRIQFLLLILALGAMPVIGHSIACRKGMIAGTASAVLIFILMRRFAFEVQTQALVLPYTIALWGILAKYIKTKSLRGSVIMGVYLGIGLLLKNFYIPVAILVCCYNLLQYKDIRGFILPLLILMTILPYTLYINHYREQSLPFIMLTDQGDDVLLTSNNDDATDGSWHPDGLARTSFYQKEEIKVKPVWMQVVMYVFAHPYKTLVNMSGKVRCGMLSRWPPVLFLSMLMGLFFASYMTSRMRKIFAAIVIAMLLGAVAIYLSERLFFYKVQISIDALLRGTGIWLFLLPLCYLLLRKAAWSYLAGPHIASWILVVSFLLLNMIFYGSDRIIGMIDFIWAFYAFLFGLELINLTAE